MLRHMFYVIYIYMNMYDIRLLKGVLFVSERQHDQHDKESVKSSAVAVGILRTNTSESA